LALGVSIQNATSAEVANQLETHLLSDLCQSCEQGENTQIILELRDETQTLIGGLVGSTSYGWLLIKILWIAQPFRKFGHGRTLVSRACSQAKEIGCHSVWLDTSDTEACAFYLGLGFVQFGLLENAEGQTPNQHSRFFLKNCL
jgi:GNAT superfamily N-acetyltransferase